MDYREPVPVTREAFQQVLSQGQTADIADALVGLVLSDPDWRWLQALCLDLLDHSDQGVRAAAVTSLGHVARIHGRIERSRVERELRRLLHDPVLAGRAHDALDDIDMFTAKRE